MADNRQETTSYSQSTEDAIALTTDVITEAPDDDGTIPLFRIILCTGLFIIICATIFGNILVLLAIATQKKLRSSNFMLYIANLAVTDLAVALIAMTFYTFDILLGYWPFGEVLCAIWIFFDYGMTFASVFTLVAISMDRFWSVTWSLHYRNHNNRKKTLIAIAIVWTLMLLTWLGPCILDRMKWSQPNICIWEPSNNKEFVVFIAVFGHHSPCVIMIFCYVWVFLKMKRRKNLIRPARGPVAKFEPTTTGEPVTRATFIPDNRTNVTADGSGSETAGGTERRTKVLTTADRERRTFVTLSYVIISYLLCWVPFHVVFDVSAIAPERVPNNVYVCTFFLTYINSTLNPLLYAFSSRDFRRAFRNVIKLKFNES